jgi:hypothetical protein
MAGVSTLINKFGKLAGWNSVTTNFLGRDVEGITELEYDDEQELENQYGAGAYPVGRGEGNYAAKASITLYLEETNAIQRSLPPGMRLSQIAPFDIVVEYEYNGFKVKDRIHNCQFKGRGVAVKQNDKVIAYKHELVVSHISWNVL